MTKLYIIRGVPGSGKSTLARQLAGDQVYEADQWMTDGGEYRFDPSRLHFCHQSCQRAVAAALDQGVPVVAVANTFVKHRDYAPYVQMAQERGVEVEIVVASGSWENVHGVPAATVDRMRAQFQV